MASPLQAQKRASVSRDFGYREAESGSVKIFSHFNLGWRRPALAQAVIAPLVCWSLSSSSMFLVERALPAMCRKRAAARLRADWPSGKAPTTRVRRLISRKTRSSGLY
jgi:hypothetical protein